MTDLAESELIETSLPIFKEGDNIVKELKVSILKDGGFDINTLGDWNYCQQPRPKGRGLQKPS